MNICYGEVGTWMNNKDTHASPPVGQPAERWVPCPFGFEGLYEVSNLGRVRSLDRVVMSRNRWGPIEKHLTGKILSQSRGSYGYLAVNLCREGKIRPYLVHRLVAVAFLDWKPGLDTRHGPAGKLDNSVMNLTVGTRAENEQDKIRDGTFRHRAPKGEANGNSRLTADQVTEIRRRYKAGEGQSALGREFGVSYQSIRLIVYRKTWRHIP